MLVVFCLFAMPVSAAFAMEKNNASHHSAGAAEPQNSVLELKYGVFDHQINETVLSKSKDTIVKNHASEIISEYNLLKNMTNAQLNQYINRQKEKIYREITPGDRSEQIARMVDVKTAWLAAATIAINAGYNCAGTAITYSVLGTDYSESGIGGAFQSKITKTLVYKNYLSTVIASTYHYGSEVKAFKKTDNADLFYALHNATITIKGTMVGTPRESYEVKVFDVFDFAYDNNYDSLFTSMVNNWAWLCQNAGVLNPIKITISFSA